MPDIPNNTTTTAVLELAASSDLIGTYSGRLETAGDRDWVRVTLTAGVTYDIFLCFQEIGFNYGDPELIFRSPTGAIVDSNDDRAAATFDSFLQVTPTATGDYFLDVNASLNRGVYSLFVTSGAATNVFLNNGIDNAVAGTNERLAGAAGDDQLVLGTSGRDALGETGDDSLVGNALANVLSGGIGDDRAFGQGGADIVFGDAGDDHLEGGDQDDQLFGGDGFDELEGENGNDVLRGGAEIDDLLGGAGNDVLQGGEGDDSLDGGADNDILTGGTGNDALNGGDGNDTLTGGPNRDILTGGADRDLFDFNAINESVKGGNRDRITDFQRGTDDIDLRTIDAKTGVSGNQAFKFIGKQNFHDQKGELRYADKGAKVIVQGDVNGDGKADFEIFVAVGALAKGDFLL